MSEVATKQAVAVWEWENKYGRWRPYTPEVCQQLERSFTKGLKSVYLGDADPALSKFIVYLQPCFQQECMNSGATWRVRRELYCPNSPPGKGVCWKWSGDSEGTWHTYGMAVQCFIEDAYMKGEQTLDVSRVFPTTPYIINFCNMTQVRCNTGFVRSTLRIQIQSYPLVKVSASEPLATDHMTASLAVQLTGGSLASTASADGFGTQLRSKKKSKNKDKAKARGGNAVYSSDAGILMGSENRNPSVMGSLASAAKAKEFLRKLTTSISTKSHGQPSTPKKDGRESGGLGVGSQSVKRDKAVKQQFASPASVASPTETSFAPVRGRMASQRSQRTSTSGTSGGNGLERRPSLDTISTYLSVDSNSVSVRRSGRAAERLKIGSSSSHYSQSIGSPSCMSSAPSDDVFLDPMEEAMSKDLLRGPQPFDSPCEFFDSSCLGNGATRWTGSSPHILEGSSVSFLESISTPVNEIVDARDACVICCEPLASPSSYDLGSKVANGPGAKGPHHIVALNICRHPMHWNCLRAMQRSNKLSYVQCPNCTCIHGEKRGNQPPGEMNHSFLKERLPGHEDCNTIVITYSIFPGVQGMNHPCPGKPYVVKGFPKKCYLPNNQKGKRVLSLLYKAWSRGLIFTIGSACTTGEANTVVWNGIHHKTEMRGGPPAGYPDPFYLDNVVIELRAQNIE